MDELKRSEERLEKLRAELLAAEGELKPLEESWRERADREVDELIGFARERNHSWIEWEEQADAVRKMLTAGIYGGAFSWEGPHYKEREKVERLESKIEWWERKVRNEEWEARKAQALAKRSREE